MNDGLIKIALVREFADAFERKERTTGDEFYSLKAGSPEWMTEAVRKAHDDFLPDDWRYRFTAEIAEEMAEALESEEDLDDARYERIDGLIPIYNADRIAWVGSNLMRSEYCNEAHAEGSADGSDFYQLLAAGIERELAEIWFALESFFVELTEEMADEEEEEE